VKTSSAACSLCLVGKIRNQQASLRFQYPRNLCKPLALERRWQMMHHQGGEHHIEGLIGIGKVLNYPDLELDGEPAPGSFRTSTSNLPGAGIDTCHATRCAVFPCHLQEQRACPAAHIQHGLARLDMGQGDRSLPKLTKLSTGRQGVMDPSCQVVAPPSSQNEPFG
jgi:hypothetical protein